MFIQFKIGVFGSAGGQGVEKCARMAAIIGTEVAFSNGILCTGACYGLPHEAALAAWEAGGLVLGFSPAINLADHAEKYKFPTHPYVLIFSGAEKKGRNVICTRTCDAGIFISGRWGTLNEFTLMYDEGEGKVIGLLKGSGGYVDKFLIPEMDSSEKPTKAKVIINSDPAALVEQVFRELNATHKGEVK